MVPIVATRPLGSQQLFGLFAWAVLGLFMLFNTPPDLGTPRGGWVGTATSWLCATMVLARGRRVADEIRRFGHDDYDLPRWVVE